MKLKSYLYWFSNEQFPFRTAELISLLKLFGISRKLWDSHIAIGPFIIMDLPSEDTAKRIMSRSVLAHSCMEIWSESDSLSALHEKIKTNLHLFEPFKKQSFRIRVETYGKTISMAAKRSIIDTFEYMPMEGRVDLRNPQCCLDLILYYGLDPNNVPPEPLQCFFGRWVSDGQRSLASKISLKTRKFIGNTSMDPLLSLIMGNVGLVKPGDFVFDPFVGSGSLLVAAAKLGAYVMGTDIDYMMLHAKTRPTRAKQTEREKDESIRANLKQYDVEDQYLDVVVADSSLPLWRKSVRFDAIITDPPYGIREPTEKIGSKEYYKIKEEHVEMHIPSKVEYSLHEVFTDLLDFAAERLVMGGRLVYWLPIAREAYDDGKLPAHPCLELVHNCEQTLTAFAARRLLVMEKTFEPTADSKSSMDSSALMCREKFFDGTCFENQRAKRKKEARQRFGDGSKRGQQVVHSAVNG